VSRIDHDHGRFLGTQFGECSGMHERDGDEEAVKDEA